MNKLFTAKSFVAILACLLLFSCSNEDDEVFPVGEYPITLNAVVEQQLTRSTSANSWDGGEEVALQVGGTIKKYTAATDAKLSATSGVEPFYWQSQYEIKTVTGWYPYSISAPTSWSVQSDQRTGGYQQSDLLYAPAVAISFANRETTTLPFHHQTAKLVINIVNGEATSSATDISAVKIGVNNNLALSGNYTAPAGNNSQGTWSNLTNSGIVAPKEISPTGTFLRSYAALVIPQDMSGKKFIAVTLSNGNTYYYSPNTGDADLKGGKQYTYNITVKNGYLEVEVENSTAWTSGGQENVTSKDVKISYTATNLKPGDYYYSDGTTSDGGLQRIYTDGTGVGAGSLPPTVGKTVIGIVFWTGNPTAGNHSNGMAFTDFGDPALRLEKSNCTHGLVVALQDVSPQKWQSTPSDVGAWVSSSSISYETITTGSAATDAVNKLRGYNNTQAIRAYNAQCSDANKVLPVQAIDTWAMSTPAPTNSSGWYFPSAKELSLLCGQDVSDIGASDSGGTGMRNIVNNAMENVSGATTIFPITFYLSSSENSEDNSYLRVWCQYFSNGLIYSTGKGSAFNIRSILAF